MSRTKKRPQRNTVLIQAVFSCKKTHKKTVLQKKPSKVKCLDFDKWLQVWSIICKKFLDQDDQRTFQAERLDLTFKNNKQKNSDKVQMSIKAPTEVLASSVKGTIPNQSN